MSCELCSMCKVGYTYKLERAVCNGCGTMNAVYGTYMGIENGNHVFRLRPKYECKVCGHIGHYSIIPCDDFQGIDVTEEFSVLVGKTG